MHATDWLASEFSLRLTQTLIHFLWPGDADRFAGGTDRRLDGHTGPCSLQPVCRGAADDGRLPFGHLYRGRCTVE